MALGNIIGIMVELLAAIPSVVLGLWAIFILEPFLRPYFIIINKNLEVCFRQIEEIILSHKTNFSQKIQ